MNENFIKIDPHTHSKGISMCSHVSCEEIIDEKIIGYIKDKLDENERAAVVRLMKVKTKA